MRFTRFSFSKNYSSKNCPKNKSLGSGEPYYYVFQINALNDATIFIIRHGFHFIAKHAPTTLYGRVLQAALLEFIAYPVKTPYQRAAWGSAEV